jgi:hypothetical protein
MLSKDKKRPQASLRRRNWIICRRRIKPWLN